MAPKPAPRKLGHRLAGGSFIVLSILLPVLVAFRNIAAPPAPGERERVIAAQDTPLGFFYGFTVPKDAQPRGPAEELHVIAQARRAGMLALLVISGLLYVLVAMVRGRAAAVLTCLCLCLVPAVAAEGYVLRPEQCATMIGLLGVLLVHLYPDALERRRGKPLFRWLNLGGIVVCVSLCFGVAMACLPQAGIYLLLPGGALLLVALCLAAVFPRVVRRRSIERWPYRATSQRLLPWIAMGLMNLALGYVVLVLVAPSEPPAASSADVGMLPGSWFLWLPALALLVLGGLRMVLGIGLKLGRQGHVRRDALLLIYAAALVLDHLRGSPRDHLPAAPALAILMGEGAAVLLLIGAGGLRDICSR